MNLLSTQLPSPPGSMITSLMTPFAVVGNFTAMASPVHTGASCRGRGVLKTTRSAQELGPHRALSSWNLSKSAGHGSHALHPRSRGTRLRRA